MDLLLLLLRLLMAAALYLFLGAIFYLLWRDLRRPSTDAQAVSRRFGQLVVVATEPEEEQSEETLKVGTTFPLQPVTSLGRSAVNTVITPDAFASAEHALLIHRGGQWWIEDRGSRNGTTLNAVVINGPTVISAGDVIGIGRVQLKLELGDS
jgi:pSer/pThr/pTyr-binding forkhead associated (FHA) protein